MKKNKEVFGTYEWAVANANFINGCSHDCKYCYSKEMAIRFKRKTASTWAQEDVNNNQINQSFGKKNGYIMFPSTHDITPVNLDLSISFLRGILLSGNKVLIVSKPHLSVITTICRTFSNFKSKILFRFTIGSVDSDVLQFWEPNAPDYSERKQSLIFAYEQGFKTSLSCEPMLDDNVQAIVNDLEQYVTDSIWIGKMNFLLRRLKANNCSDEMTLQKADQLIRMQSDDKIKQLYSQLCNNPKIKWKESIKKVVGLEISNDKGCDC